MKLTKNFSLDEMIRSTAAIRNGIDNTPTVKEIANLQRLCEHVLEPARELSGGKTIRISSGFRNPKVNKLIGGSPTSDHVNGNAADFTIDGMSVTEVVEMIAKSNIQFDQLIHEFDSWVHVSFNETNRREVLAAKKDGKKTVYEKYN